MSIRKKLFFSNATMSGVILLVGVVFWVLLQYVDDQFAELRNHSMNQRFQLYRIQMAGFRIIASTSEFALVSSIRAQEAPADIAPGEIELKQLREGIALLRDALDTYNDFVIEFFPHEMSTVRTIKAKGNALIVGSRRMVDLVVSHASLTEIGKEEKNFEATEEAFLKAIAKLHTEEEEEEQKILDKIGDALLVSGAGTIIGSLLVMAIIIALGMLIDKHITDPLRKLKDGTERIARGDFTVNIDINSRDELGELGGAFNSMAEQLAESQRLRKQAEEGLLRNERLAAIGQVTATVSHELRNPLGAVRNSLNVIKRLGSGEDPRLRGAVELAGHGITRCEGLISDLLDFTRQPKLELRPTLIDDWLEKALGELRVPAGITLSRELTSGAEIAFDQERIRRAIINVVDNACHAMTASEGEAGNGSNLTVATRLHGKRLEVVVSDTGAGIPEEELEKVFEPLFTTKSFGVGLGLPTVKRIMEQHGGGIEISSEAGSGTQVVLWFSHKNEEKEQVHDSIENPNCG